MKTSVKTVACIQIRTEHESGVGWNRRYMQPSPAAKDWSSLKKQEWIQKHSSLYTSMNPGEYDRLINKIEDKYYRRSLPVFKAMVSVNKKKR